MKKVKISRSVWSLATLTLLAVVTFAGIAQANPPVCTDTLLSTKYSCLVNDPLVTDLQVCLEFASTMNENVFSAVMLTDYGPYGIIETDFRCGCKIRGSFSNPQYNASQENFLCSYEVADMPDYLPGAAEGKITGIGGNLLIEAMGATDGTGWLIECTPDPNCMP